MSVVTISRELGSGGERIAQEVAQALGYHLADKSTLETMLAGYGMVHFKEDYDQPPGIWERLTLSKNKERSVFIKLLDQAMAALANHGDVVIIGRGGFSVLAGLADVLNVRIQAPLALRISRTQESPALAEPSLAEAAVKENDRLQETFIQSIYGIRWDAARAFDLVIDTGKTSLDLAATLIIKVVNGLEEARPRSMRTAAQMEVDRMLASTVQEALNCPFRHHEGKLALDLK